MASIQRPTTASLSAAFPALSAQPCLDDLSSAASTEVVAPPDSVQDKIGFVLNNMQASNVGEQSASLREVLDGQPGCVQWFAQYLVVKRVSLEPNFHGLYGAMLSELSMRPLNRVVLQSTLQNARVLLASPKIRSSSSQRSLLKNLGSWLGQITLARNKPILFKQLNIKELLFKCGIDGKPHTFLFNDTQIADESFLEDVNGLLNAGEVSSLFAPDETERIIGGCRDRAKKRGQETRDGIWADFVSTVRENLHIVLAMSPVGSAFGSLLGRGRVAARRFARTCIWFSSIALRMVDMTVSPCRTCTRSTSWSFWSGPSVDTYTSSCPAQASKR